MERLVKFYTRKLGFRSRKREIIAYDDTRCVRKSASIIINVVSAVGAFLFVALLPPLFIFMFWLYWNDSPRVDKRTCSCSCWDTVFKGTYENGIAAYKHLYFNATENMLIIWLLIMVFAFTLYECIKYLLILFLSSELRFAMAFLFFSSVFSHYYSVWMYINYYNDDFYDQWHHQMLFTVSEIVSSSIILWMANVRNKVKNLGILVVSGLAVLHIFASSMDQFIVNVIQGEGYNFQIVRDIFFMVPDVFHLLIPLCYIRSVPTACESLVLFVFFAIALFLFKTDFLKN